MHKPTLLCLSAVCAIGCGPDAGSWSRSQEPLSRSESWSSCGPLVLGRGVVIDVRPSGGEDTANLQCALDLAVASGKWVEIRLAAGTFHTDVLVAKGFRGRLHGAGAGATTIRNVDRPVRVNPSPDSIANEPTAATGVNPNPYLITFIDGDFHVSDLTLHIGGRDPTAGWSLDAQTSTTAFAVGIAILGRHADASFERVVVEGEPGDELFGKNVANGIYYEALIGLDPPPLSGSFEVRDCTFRGMASGAPVFNVRGARIHIIGNHFEDITGNAADVLDLDGVDFVFAGNELKAGAPRGIAFFDGCFGPSAVCGMSHGSILVAGNDLHAVVPVVVRSTFGEGIRCTVAGNALHPDLAAGGVDVLLGRGTHDCLVVTPGPVSDLGTNNRVIRR